MKTTGFHSHYSLFFANNSTGRNDNGNSIYDYGVAFKMVLPYSGSFAGTTFTEELKALAEFKEDLLLCGEAYSLVDSIKSK